MKRSVLIAGGVILAIALVAGTLALDQRRPPTKVAEFAASVNSELAETTTSTVATSMANGAQPGTATPQKDPVPLSQVTTPPAHTLAFIDPAQYSADSSYAVTFVPYGLGSTPNSLVIQVLESKPIGTVSLFFDLAGRNVLVDTSRLPATMAIKKGGTYTGTILLVKESNSLSANGVLAPILLDDSPQD